MTERREDRTEPAPDPSPDVALPRRGVVRLAGAALATTALGLPAVAPAAATSTLPRISTEGNRLVAGGEPVTLRGLSLIDPKRANTTATDRGLDALGTVDLVTDADAGWHPTVLRVPVQPVDIGDHEPGTAPDPPAFTREQLETYLQTHLDPVVDRCAERGVYAIVDYHRHWPGLAWGDTSTGTINADLQAETMLFWDVVAARYADRDHVLFEVYNEPTEPGMWGPTSEPWVRDVWSLFLEFVQPVVDTVRAHTDTVVLVGSPGWSQSPEGALIEPVAGGNIAYTFHIYPGHESSQQGAWDDSTINGEGVERVYEQYPLFVTEFGWRDFEDQWLGGTTTEFGEPFMQWLESNDAINWTAWCTDVWWEPALFEQSGDQWLLRGRDTGSSEDAGEFVRQTLADFAAADGSTDTTSDGSTDDGSADTTDDSTTDDSTTEGPGKSTTRGNGKGRLK